MSALPRSAAAARRPLVPSAAAARPGVPAPDAGAARLVLGIETSCDDCSVAVLEAGERLRAHLIAGQDIHRLYGGVVPPSLAGNNPAAAQLRQQAATNLSTMAGTAQRYTAIASGQAAPDAYLPPMAGGGAGIAGGGGSATRRGGRSGPRIAEPASVWGAVGGGGSRPDRRRTPSRPTAEVEDDSVWSAGTTAPRSLDAC